MNDPANAKPEALVVTVIALMALLNVPDAPDSGAANVTLTPLTVFPAASFTVTESAVPKAVLMAADWGEVPEPAVMLAGTWTAGKDTVPLVAEALAPPPEAVAALVVVGLTALAGTDTLIPITLKEAPPTTACVLVQVTVFVPEQFQPLALKDAALKPVGSASVTVVVPEVELEAPPMFDTVSVSVPPVCPCVNVPLDTWLTLKRGTVPNGTGTVLLVAIALAPPPDAVAALV